MPAWLPLFVLVAAGSGAPSSWTITTPFSTAGVRAMASAPDGPMWIAGQAGLQRFDGFDLQTLQPQTAPALMQASQVFRVAFDQTGAMWVGLGGGTFSFSDQQRISIESAGVPGLVRHVNGVFQTFTRRDGLGDDRVWALLPDGANLWVGTETGLWLRREERFHHEPAAGRSLVLALARETTGALLVGSVSGLCRLRAGACERLLSEPVTSIAVRDGVVWAGTPRGLVSSDGRRLTRAQGLPSDDVRALQIEGERLWVGTTAGLAALDREGHIQSFGVRDGLPEERIYALAVDREGALWAGTASAGVARLFQSPVSTLEAPDVTRVYAVEAAPDGSVWATVDTGLMRWQGGRFTLLRAGRELPEAAYRSLALGPDGTVWVATHGQGLLSWDGRQAVPIRQSDGLPSNAIRSIRADASGALWLGTYEGELVRVRVHDGRATILSRFDARTGLCGGQVLSGVAAKDGAMLFATTAGLVRVRDARAQCLVAGPLSAVHAEPDGTLWIAAREERGLMRLRDQKLTVWRESDGLPCDSLVDVVDDGAGHLWLACGAGVIRVSKADLEGRRGLTPWWFHAGNGLRSQEASFAAYPVLRAGPAGEMFVATVTGLARIDVRRPLPVAPRVRLGSVLVDGVARSLPVEVRARTVDLDLGFGAAAFTHPRAIRFRHRLSGFEDAWRETTGGEATYRRVPPGRYQLEVAAANAYGVWGQGTFLGEIVVRRPITATLGFQIGLGAAVMVLLWSLHRVRLHRATARLRAVAEERSRIARDLHDGLGQAFSAIGFHVEALMEVIKADTGPAREMAAQTRQIVRDAEREVRRAIWDLRAEALGVRPLREALADLVRARARLGGPRLQLHVEGEPARRDPYVEGELYQVAVEALVNVERHAQARNVTVTIAWQRGSVRLEVRDDGRGMSAPSGVAEGRFGILGMRERVRRLGGTLSIRSAPGEGTAVEVSVPVPEVKTA